MPNKIYLPLKDRIRNNKCLLAFDPALSNHIMDVSVHTINSPCLITAKDIFQIKQAFTEYCLKNTKGHIVCNRFRNSLLAYLRQILTSNERFRTAGLRPVLFSVCFYPAVKFVRF